MNEQELDKFVEDQYKTWCDNNDISKVEDIDQKNLKEVIEKEIENEINEAQKEVSELKKSSISDIQHISKDIASNIIENISGDKLNESSITAAVEDVSKKKIGKYL